MRRILVEIKDDNKRIDRFLTDRFAGVPAAVFFKAFRKRNIRVNGRRVSNDFRLHAGDIVEIFIPDEYVSPIKRDDPESRIDILYEDEYIMVVFKPQGIPVHQDSNREDLVLDQYLQALMVKRQDGTAPGPGFPALCHRIDRNTGGLVILAKDEKSLEVMKDKFKNHEIRKFYLACTYGIPSEKEAEYEAYLKKDAQNSQVRIFDRPVRGSMRIVTRFRLLKAVYPYALLEVELVTGRTHQIRAHLAWLGYPILGDGKYGISDINRSLKLKMQALFHYRLRFEFKNPGTHLDCLNGREISLPSIPWQKGINDTGLLGNDLFE